MLASVPFNILHRSPKNRRSRSSLIGAVNFDAAGGADFQSLVFSVTDTRNGKACKPVFPGQTANGWEPVVTGPTATR